MRGQPTSLADLIPGPWRELLQVEFAKAYFQKLQKHYENALKNNWQTSSGGGGWVELYPAPGLIFRALDLTPPDSIKLIILGQDPYHRPGQATGLAFSVPSQTPLPPSLKNIFKELNADLGGSLRKNGDLSDWATQGVLLLNSILTVPRATPLGCASWGWEGLTDAIISGLGREKSGLIFLLWGSFARSKGALIDPARQLILEAAHPSPLSARGFLGRSHFSRANEFLRMRGREMIRWHHPSHDLIEDDI